MNSIPPDQRSTYGPGSPTSRKRRPPLPPGIIHQREGDRSSGDDDTPSGLTRYVRYRDLVTAGVVRNWPTLLRLIDVEGFPAGIMIGPNSRAWALHEVEAWLDARPSARKIVNPAHKPRSRKPAEESSA
jgi:predicted DNA-binding transcriptional regulator AlpA